MNDPFDALKVFLADEKKTHTMLTIVVHGEEKPVIALTELPVRNLIEIAKRKLEREEQNKRYGLYLGDDPVPLNRTIHDLFRSGDLQPTSKLVLRPFVQGMKIKDFLYIVDPTTNTDITRFNRFPAIIGRKTPDTPDVIDLGQVSERARTISRRHAEIKEEGDAFVIKCLSQRGLTVKDNLLAEPELESGSDHPLAESESMRIILPAEIQFGKEIRLRIERRPAPSR